MRVARILIVAAGTLFLAWNAAIGSAQVWLEAQTTGRASLPFLASAQVDLRQRLSRSEEATATSIEYQQGLKELASAMIATDPLDVTAMAAYGKVIGQSDAANSSQIFELAELVSRRSLVNELELIAVASRNGDVVAALRHHDRALRVYPSETSSVLFASQAKSMQFEQVRSGLVKYVRASWFAGLVQSAMGNGARPADVVDLVLSSARQLETKQAQSMREMLIGQLTQRSEFELVRSVINDMPEDVRNGLSDFGFTGMTTRTELSPITWRLSQNGKIDTNFEAGGALLIRLAPETGGVVAERTTMLSPGRYVLQQELTFPSDTPPARLHWTVRCHNGSTPIWQADVRPTPDAKEIREIITIPYDCPVQAWALSGVAQVSQFASSVTVKSQQLRRQY